MTVGNTITTSLADSLPTVIASARVTREQEGVMAQLVDRETLEQGTGLSWNEITLAHLTAMAITETTDLSNNPQMLSDTLFSIKPTQIGIHTVITDEVARRISAKAYAKTGQLAEMAMVLKVDQDGLAVLDGATTSLAGAGTTLTSGHIGAAVRRITSNTTEPGPQPIRAVLQGYQIKDIEDEMKGGIGTYPIPEGETARVFREGFRGGINGAQVYEDGNIVIDGSDDAKGGVFSQQGIVLVQGFGLKTEIQRLPNIGGGANALYMYESYAYGERSAGNWLIEIYSDATAPTS